MITLVKKKQKKTYFHEHVVIFSPHLHTLTVWLSQWEAELSESALIGYRRPVNEISMHGQTEILGALPEAGARSGGEFPTLTCKTCILCDTALEFHRPSANAPLAPLMCGRRQEGGKSSKRVVTQTCFTPQRIANGVYTQHGVWNVE